MCTIGQNALGMVQDGWENNVDRFIFASPVYTYKQPGNKNPDITYSSLAGNPQVINNC